MGCICECHDKLNKIGVLGCCFACQKDHDTLRNALAQRDTALRAIRAIAPYCKVKYGMDEAAVNEIERLSAFEA